MKHILTLICGTLLFSACNTQTEQKPAVLADFSDSASYAIGTTIGLNLVADFEAQGVDSSFNKELVVAGLSEAITKGETQLTKEQAQEQVGKFFDQLNEQRANKNLVVGQTFLNDNKGKAGVVTTESGLQYIVLKEGEGNSPSLADQVVVHYTGKLLNGEVFDSSIERNEPVTFYVRSVIPGWTEALQLMKPGAEYKLFIPSELAYGVQGGPRGSGIGPNEVLIFDVKLIDITK
jgi:FKBP-type peptidyl-prolyl cis-trans isomerase FklB